MLSGHHISNELAQAVKNQSPVSSLIAENSGHETKQTPHYKQTFAKLFRFLAALEETVSGVNVTASLGISVGEGYFYGSLDDIVAEYPAPALVMGGHKTLG